MASAYLPSPHDPWGTKETSKQFTQKTPTEVLNQLMTQLVYRGVGFNAHTMFFSELANTLAAKSTYPPYDILSSEENKYEIRMALAGFKKSDLEITFQNQVLTIKTKDLEDDGIEGAYFHKGIASRSFTQAFPLAEYVNVVSAEMADGILTISLERELPDEVKPRTIKIK
jgi:molecular chaperone IbpA